MARNSARNAASAEFIAVLASESTRPMAQESATRAIAETVAESLRRRSSCQGGGQIRRQAGMQKAPASSQPRRRGPTADAGWATATGSTKTRSAAVAAVAARGVTTPR